MRTLSGKIKSFLNRQTFYDEDIDGELLLKEEVEKFLLKMKQDFPCYNPDKGCDLVCVNCHLPQLWCKYYFGAIET